MLRTPLYAFHREAGARLVDFAGWEMPVAYSGIIDEHQHTRNHASFFDVSHMGRVEFHGARAGEFLEWLNTRKVGDMAVGQSRYSHICNERGGILDDVIVSRCADSWMVVCNASNREKLLGWWNEHRRRFGVELHDRTLETAMIAIQGPEAVETLDNLLPFTVGDLKRYWFKAGKMMGSRYHVARSGYTGEDGVEVIIPADYGVTAANMMVEQTAKIGRPIQPAGLGARDTLRTEAAMPLYGHELTEEWDPITAGQAWVVAPDKEFCGKAAIQAVKDGGGERILCGFDIDSRRTPRQGAPILVSGEAVGVITSGTASPTLGKVIAMGFLPPAHAAPGTTVEIDLKTSSIPAKVVPLPFYKRKK